VFRLVFPTLTREPSANTGWPNDGANASLSFGVRDYCAESRERPRGTCILIRASAESSVPLVVLIKSEDGHDEHAEALSRSGFQVMRVPARGASVPDILDQSPNVIAIELRSTETAHVFDLVRRFRESPKARLIPVVVYGHHLRVDDIEAAARAGALWLQLEPTDGARLAAAARGLVAAARRETTA